MKLPAKHSEFIRLVANGESQVTAYKVTCGNKSVTSNVAKVKGSQLAKKYADLIAQERERIKKVVEAATDSKVAEIAQKRIMSAAERMDYLTAIIEGRVKVKRPFVIAGKIMEYPAEPDINERIKALAELNKMNGDYQPHQIDIKSGGEKVIQWVMLPAQKSK